jgi:hypothetical protein
MQKEKEIKYYYLKDYDLIQLFIRLLDMTDGVKTDIEDFIKTNAPSAKLHSITTDGNLQMRIMAFDWIFPSLKHIPEKTYTDFQQFPNGVVAKPDVTTEKGKKLKEEQMMLLHAGTADIADLWYGELAPLLDWEVVEEPGLIYNVQEKTFILVTDEQKPHGKLTKYQPPLGVVNINKARVEELMPLMN